MSRSIPVTIGDFHFTSKKNAREYVQKILNNPNYTFGKKKVAPAHERFLRSLLSLHPNYEAKCRGGIKGFVVREANHFYSDRNDGKQSRHQGWCFWIIRDDGTHEDFSIYSCLDGKKKNGGFALKRGKSSVKNINSSSIISSCKANDLELPPTKAFHFERLYEKGEE